MRAIVINVLASILWASINTALVALLGAPPWFLLGFWFIMYNLALYHPGLKK